MTAQWIDIQRIRDLGFPWPPANCPDSCIIKDGEDRVDLDATITNLRDFMERERSLAADSQYFMNKYKMSFLDYDELKDNRSRHQYEAYKYQRMIETVEKIKIAMQSD